MRVVSLFSGGKDSTFALWYAQMQGWTVEALVTMIPKSTESWMFHHPAVKWTQLQADAIGIRRVSIDTFGEKESELEDLKGGLRELMKNSGIDGLVSGAVSSEYQRTRLDNLCDELGLRSFTPLWHKDQEQLVREQLDAGFEIIVTACSAMGLDAKWLGKQLGSSDLKKLVELRKKYGVNVAFEGGEAETFVLWAPMFNRRLKIVHATPVWRGESGFLQIDEMTFVAANDSSCQ
jgi:ABC transporter with metal-binding/Fe-S-binding domain ATP-binding protein